ncbi:MAG: hypothetical protein ABIV94_10685 [Acidimicrobiales bacterium]
MDRAAPGLVAGVLVGRAVTMLSSPGGLHSLSDFLVIRGGAEFWAGTVAGGTAVAVGARRRRESPIAVLADIAPYGLVGYGVYTATCVLREGCYGPVSALGLRPPGTATTMVPVELLSGVAVLGVAYLLRNAWGLRPLAVLTAAVIALAAARLAGAALLPNLDGRWTRSTVESLAALAVAGGVGVVEAGAARRRRCDLPAAAVRHPER